MALSNDVQYVRFLISDASGAVFSDAEIDMVLARNGSYVYLSAAILMERIADNETLIAKKIRDQDLSTDGPAVAADLRKSAARMRDDHAAWLESEADVGFAVVEYEPYPRWPELAPGTM